MASFFKRLGRKTAKVSTKVNRVFTPVASAAAGFIGGAPAAAAVTALGAQAGYYFRATQARNEGVKGRDARARGRGERKRVAIYGAAAGGAGMLGSGAYTLATGGTFGQAVGTTFLGQGGKALVFGSEGTMFAKPANSLSGIVTAGNLAAQKASPVPGIVTQSQLAPTLAGGSSSAESAAAAAGKAGESSLLSKTLGLATAVGNKIPLPGTPGGQPMTGPGNNSYQSGLLDGLLAGAGMGGGGGDAGGGMGAGGFMNAPMDDSKMSPAVLVALGVGAILLLS